MWNINYQNTKVQEKLTLDGNIVFTPNFFNNLKNEINIETKNMLDEMHRQKIDMSNEIYVINFGGYIGESTKSEIEYAKANGNVKKYFYNEIEKLPNALIVPLGKAVEEVLEKMIKDNLIKEEQCLLGFPHPSGANVHRKNQFKENKIKLLSIVEEYFKNS